MPEALSGRQALTLPGLTRKMQAEIRIQWLLVVLLYLGALGYALRFDPLQKPWPLRLEIAVGFFLLLMSVRRAGTLPLVALVYLAFLGVLRRALNIWFPVMHKDPLLVVVPLFTALFFLEIVFSRRLKLDNTFGKLRMLLLLLMAFEIFNPKQGGLAVGLGGALFYLPPIFWMYIGRELGTQRVVRNLTWMVVLVGMLGALYGVHQTLYGVTWWEQKWLNSEPLTSIMLGNSLREFSFFTSTLDYATFLEIAIVFSWILVLQGQRIAALPMVFMMIAMFYVGGRGPIVLYLAAMVVIWSVQNRNPKIWVPRLALAAVLAVAGLVYSLNHAQSLALNQGQAANIQHDQQGLLHPLNAKDSTAGIHAASITGSITNSFSMPLGEGLGATTLAVSQLGGTGGNSEFDVSNMFLSLGPLGGIVYVLMILCGWQMALKCWGRTRDFSALAAIAACALGGWLSAGNYSCILVLCFVMGALERQWVGYGLHHKTAPLPPRFALPGGGA